MRQGSGCQINAPREKDAANFAMDLADLTATEEATKGSFEEMMWTNIDALGIARELIEKGRGTNCLLTTAASAVRRLVVEMDLSPRVCAVLRRSADRLDSCLSQGDDFEEVSGWTLIGLMQVHKMLLTQYFASSAVQCA